MINQLFRFAAAGVIGFVIDVAVLYLLVTMGIGLLQGRIGSFLAAATTTWMVNRHYTFGDCPPPPGLAATGHQWLRFVAANALGGTVNLLIYGLLVMNLPMFREFPVLAVAAGALGGLAVNYNASRYWVFRNAS